MRLFVFLFFIAFACVSCNDHDTWSWENDTNGPPAAMADTNQCIDIHTWPDDNRTASPAYYHKKKKEIEERMQRKNQNN